MVDISSKDVTARTAKAGARVRMSPETVEAVRQGGLTKGDAIGAARIAGIMAAKKTHELIPLCHPLAITGVKVEVKIDDEGAEIVTSVTTLDRTGVEMEALVAASVAALTIYDMCKAVDKSMTIEDVRLLTKTGGRSGDYRADG